MSRKAKGEIGGEGKGELTLIGLLLLCLYWEQYGRVARNPSSVLDEYLAVLSWQLLYGHLPAIWRVRREAPVSEIPTKTPRLECSQGVSLYQTVLFLKLRIKSVNDGIFKRAHILTFLDIQISIRPMNVRGASCLWRKYSRPSKSLTRMNGLVTLLPVFLVPFLSLFSGSGGFDPFLGSFKLNVVASVLLS
ncbi:hypothetical protein Tco_0885809 [Tanacetum coccineum]